ncbi:MAG: IS3 family transposase [Anaerolineales bacterium]|nr:IS3 family transposase [Anaerolineales bacterium]
MGDVYQRVGVTRQAHHQHKRRAKQRAEQETAIASWVRQKREKHPCMGTRKLWQEMQPWLTEQDWSYGRDRLFGLLRREGLLLEPPRRRRRTTYAGLWRGPNRLAEANITAPNQAWVSDITYIETEEGFTYLSLVTDVYSRRIMGYDLSSSLAVEGALRAFQMAYRYAAGSLAGLIHHSDHGVQYTCHAYRDALSARGILPSMGEVGNCYDNALAERVNGILKLEYGLEHRFVSQTQAQQAVREAVWLYNHERPHLSLAYQKPHQVYISAMNKRVH